MVSLFPGVLQKENFIVLTKTNKMKVRAYKSEVQTVAFCVMYPFILPKGPTWSRKRTGYRCENSVLQWGWEGGAKFSHKSMIVSANSLDNHSLKLTAQKGPKLNNSWQEFLEGDA